MLDDTRLFIKRLGAFFIKIVQGYFYTPEKYFESIDTAQNSHSNTTANNSWDIYTSKIKEEMRRSPFSFLREETISRTVHPYENQLADAYLTEMSESSFCRQSILPRLTDSPFGTPWQCLSFPHASPVSVQHAYYCWLMKMNMGLFIPDNKVKRVVEFGGGYGNFYRLMRLWGYEGKYSIIDLPIMHSLQQTYLRGASGQHVSQNAIYTALEDKTVWEGEEPSCFMATFSLNETTLETRDAVKEHLNSFSYIFIAYNSSFDGVENVTYFSELTDYLKESFSITTFKDPHRRAWFLMGYKHA